MKAAVWQGKEKIVYIDVPNPEITQDEVLIKVHAVGVCATDVDIYTGAFENGNPPHILGHEIAGEVVQVGARVTKWNVGDRVAVETSVGCGSCDICISGQRHLCKELTEIGFPPHSGGYAQYTKAPWQNLVSLPDNISYEEAGIMEAAVCPVGALMRLGVVLGETVVVFGVGVAGISFIQGARAMGAGKIIAVGRDERCLQRAKEFGADFTINTSKENLEQCVLELTDNLGAGLVCEAAGSPSTIAGALSVAARGGRIILYGLPDAKSAASLPVLDIIMRQLSVFGTLGNPLVWKPLLELVSKGNFKLKEMIGRTMPLSEIQVAFTLLLDRKEKPLKIVLQPWHEANQ